MIGSYETLMNAAKGKFTKKDPTQTISPAPLGSAYGTAMANKSQYGQSQTDLLKSSAFSDALSRFSGTPTTMMAESTSAGARMSPTATYGNILANATRSTGGLSGKGKYSGFNTSADLESAITGAAINLKEGSVNQLRSEAGKYYGQLDTMMGDARRGAMQATTTGVRAQMPGVDPNRKYEAGSYVEKYVNPIRNYANQLGEWYQGQAKPAEEYLQTAQQLEATPLSQLATSIASRQFGMNPDLAAGKFQGLDATYWKGKRDQQYMQQYGVPYDEYQATKKEYEDLTKDMPSPLETATGFASKSLAGVTGMTAKQLSDQLVQPIEFIDPASGNTLSGSGQDALEQMKAYISGAQPDQAKKIMDDIAGRPGAEGVAALLKAYYHMAVVAPTKYDYQNAMYIGP